MNIWKQLFSLFLLIVGLGLLLPTSAAAQGKGKAKKNKEDKHQSDRHDDSAAEESIFRLPRRGGDDDRYEQRSGSKCGVRGCQHPGQHKGLHKQQDRVRPIEAPGNRQRNRRTETDDRRLPERIGIPLPWPTQTDTRKRKG